MMKRMSFSETVFLFFLALIIFGPKKLPEIARQAGKLLNEFRRASNEFKSQIEQEIAHLEVENHKQTILPPSAPPAGTASRTLEPATSALSEAASPPAEATSVPTPAETLANVDATAGPLVAHSAEPTETVPAPEPVNSTSAQESHA
jgi:sec-independent protein translocase protein TatB